MSCYFESSSYNVLHHLYDYKTNDIGERFSYIHIRSRGEYYNRTRYSHVDLGIVRLLIHSSSNRPCPFEPHAVENEISNFYKRNIITAIQHKLTLINKIILFNICNLQYCKHNLIVSCNIHSVNYSSVTWWIPNAICLSYQARRGIN